VSQSRRMSLTEAVASTMIGYGVAVATQLAVFPAFGIEASLSDSLGLGLIFTAVSVIRSYLVRRMFNRVAS